MTITLELARSHLRVDHQDENDLIARYLAASVAWVENHTSKLLTRREVTQDYECFGSYMELFYGPNPEAVTIEYTAADAAPQTIADAKLVRDRLFPASTWPTISTNTPISVTYTAGYETVPADLDAAVLVHLRAQYDEFRTGSDDPAAMHAVEALCRPYRSVRV